jgi:hypothetical protein
MITLPLILVLTMPKTPMTFDSSRRVDSFNPLILTIIVPTHIVACGLVIIFLDYIQKTLAPRSFIIRI